MEEIQIEDWQLEIIGLITGWGKIDEACEVAMDHAPEGICYLFKVAYREGQSDALKKVLSSVSKQFETW